MQRQRTLAQLPSSDAHTKLVDRDTGEYSSLQCLGGSARTGDSCRVFTVSGSCRGLSQEPGRMLPTKEFSHGNYSRPHDRGSGHMQSTDS